MNTGVHLSLWSSIFSGYMPSSGIIGLYGSFMECQRIGAFELWCWRRLLRVPLDCKEVKPVNPKGNQSWISIGRTDAEAETPILWPPHAKNWLIGKDPDAGKDWKQEEKGTTEDEMVGWHHQLDGHEFEWAPGVGDGQGSLVSCSPWSHKESDTTRQLNWMAFWVAWPAILDAPLTRFSTYGLSPQPPGTYASQRKRVWGSDVVAGVGALTHLTP